MSNLCGLIDILSSIDQGLMTPQAAITAAFGRAKSREDALRAFAFLPAEAPACGQGPLAGIAVGVKDLIDSADMPTAYGSPAYAGHRPQRDAWIVTRLRGLGATVLGKTVTTEFAFRTPGPTRNPHNDAHTPGGSSSGSAAAVGAGILPLALGTQTLGSVIRPAAFCGIVGYKPSFGTFPRDGVYPLSGALDHIGLMAAGIDDIAFAASLLVPDAGFAETLGLDPATRRLPALTPQRLAFLPLPQSGVEPAQVQAFEAALTGLRNAGFTIESLRLTESFAAIPALAETLMAYEAARIFQDLVAREPHNTSSALQRLVSEGLAISPSHHTEALAEQQALRAAFEPLMKGFDALLTIPASGEAPLGLQATGDPRFCLGWSFLGTPALTFPIGRGPAGLPLGLQLVAPFGADAALLRAAKTCAAVVTAAGVT